MAKIKKNRIGEMLNDPLAPKVSQFKYHFNNTELKFLFHAITRKSKEKIVFEDMPNLNLVWALDFLQRKQETFGNIGYMLAVCLQGKLKDLTTNNL
jgi:hypothetical protein